MFGEGQPINEVDRKWDLDSILIIYNKYQDGSSAITCINKELDNKISKYRPSKKLLFSIIKNQIFEKYVNLPTSIDDDIFIYDQYSYMYRFIPYVLKNS